MRRRSVNAAPGWAGLLLWLVMPAAGVAQDASGEFQQLQDQSDKQQNAREYAELERTALRMRRLAEGPLRGDQTYLARAAYRQAAALHVQDRCAEAERFYREAAAVGEKAFGPEHAFIADVLLDTGNACLGQSKYGEAESFYKRALAIRRKRLGTQHADVAAVLHNLGIVCQNQQRWADAERYYRQTLEIREKVLDPNDLDLAWTLNNVGAVCFNLGQFADAERLHKRALAIRRKVLGHEHPDVAASCHALASAVWSQDRGGEAEPLLRRALAVREKALGPDDPDLALTLQDLAVLCREQSLFAEAEQFSKQAVGICRKVFGDESEEAAEALTGLAMVYESQWRCLEAEPLYRQALEIRRKLLGGNHPELAMAHYSLGCAQYSIGKYSAAEVNLNRAIAMGRQVFGDIPEVADAMLALAEIYRELGRYEDAEDQINQAQPIFERHSGETGKGIAACLSGRGYLRYRLGRFAEAELLMNRALELAERNQGPDSVAVAEQLGGLAELYGYQGRFEEAAQYSRRAHEICRTKLPVGDLQLAGCAWQEGWILGERGQYAKAMELLNQCVPIYDRTLGRDNRSAAELRYDLAKICYAVGKYDDAEKLLKEAFDILVKYAGGERHPLAAWAHNALARVYLAVGKPDEAEASLEKALRLAPGSISSEMRCLSHLLRARLFWRRDDHAAAVADLNEAMSLAEEQRGRASGAEHQRAKYFTRLSEAFEQMVAWQCELGDCAAALNAMERSRARSLIDQMTVQGVDLLAGVDESEAGRLRSREREARETVARLEAELKELGINSDLSGEELQRQSDKLAALLRDARQAYVLAYGAIRNASPAYRLAVGQDQKPVTLDELRRWVKEQGGLLLQYHVGAEGSHVLTVQADGEASMSPIELTEKQAEKLLAKAGPLTLENLAAILANQQKTGVMDLLRIAAEPANIAAVDSKLAALWEVLIPENVRKSLLAHNETQDVRRLMIVPDGPLAMLPFETLVVDPHGGDQRYLLDVGPPVQYAPSATVLINLANRGDGGRPSPEPVLSVGDPAYGRESEDDRRSAFTPAGYFAAAAGRLSRLPHSADEILWIEQVFDEAGISATRLAGDEATEANVRRLAPGRMIVHLACHGVVDQAHGNLFGALALTPVQASDSSNDGFLTLAEIYGLDMKGCELAILSACDTNFGPQQQGEGVWSVARGFLAAGARRVAASNWLVDDQAAANLVFVFCGAAARAQTSGHAVDYAGALHQAKCWIRKQSKWSSPYYWGTFVLVGPS